VATEATLVAPDISGSGRVARRRALSAVLAVLLVPVLLLPSLLLTAGPSAAIENTWTARSVDDIGAADLAKGGQGVTVAVLDSWIDRLHPDFRGHVLAGGTCTKGACQPGGADVPDSCEAHGTHVAGLVGSSRFGVAPEATILPVRVLTETNGACSAQAEDVASGIRFAASQHAQIINISLGSTYALSDRGHAIPRAVTDATHQGAVVVVAAGNGKTAGADVYGPDALVVAATAPNGTLATYSQRGAGVDLAAPGGQPVGNGCTPDDCVVSTWSDRSYAADAGTSMAAPIVSGAAALLLAQKPDRGRGDIVSTLTRTAHPLAGAGAGRVDVLAALRGSAAPIGNGTDSNPAVGAGTGPAGPAAAVDPGVARVIRPNGRTQPASPPPTTTLTSGQHLPSTKGILTGAAAALVLMMLVAIIVVARTQHMVAPAAGIDPDEDEDDDYDDGYDDDRYPDDRYADDEYVD
jgi:subtilisin family serine protease